MKIMNGLVGLAAVGTSLTGILGLTLGLVAFISGDSTGAGTCLIAAAVAFGFSMRTVLTS